MPAIKRILVVEDNPDVAEILQWNLIGAGYAVSIADDGLKALRAFDEERPDLVTVDLNVPSVSGFRLVELFKRFAPEIPILVVTAATFEEAEEIARSGADDFVSKPFEPSRLVQKVDYYLQGPHPDQAPPLLPERQTTFELA